MENQIEKQFKLPKEFAIKWLEALRSGIYQQSTGKLYDGTGYCCLGVAGEVCNILTSDLFKKPLFDVNEYEAPFSEEELFSKGIPIELIGTAEIDVNPSNKLVRKLVSFNDGILGEEKKSFSEIADWIEENCLFY